MPKQDPTSCKFFSIHDGETAVVMRCARLNTLYPPCLTVGICPKYEPKPNQMTILLKDPKLVEAVIKKITDRNPCHFDLFLRYGVESLKMTASEDNPILLEVDWGYSQEHQGIESKFRYSPLKDIPTDQEFLNDEEW